MMVSLQLRTALAIIVIRDLSAGSGLATFLVSYYITQPSIINLPDQNAQIVILRKITYLKN